MRLVVAVVVVAIAVAVVVVVVDVQQVTQYYDYDGRGCESGTMTKMTVATSIVLSRDEGVVAMVVRNQSMTAKIDKSMKKTPRQTNRKSTERRFPR